MSDTTDFPPNPDKKRRGRAGKAVKKSPLLPAEFVAGGPAANKKSDGDTTGKTPKPVGEWTAPETVDEAGGAAVAVTDWEAEAAAFRRAEGRDGCGDGTGAADDDCGDAGREPEDGAAFALRGEPVFTDEDIDLLQAEETREIAAAYGKLQRKEALTTRERALLKRAKTEQGRRRKEADGFDPERICQGLNAYWVNGDGSNFQIKDGSKEWLQVPESKLLLALVRRGVPEFAVAGEALSRLDQCVMHTMENRNLDRAIPAIAGYREGIHLCKDARVLVRKGPRLIEPKKGDWNLIADLIGGRLLREDEPTGDARWAQVNRFNYWMSRAAENVYNSPGVRLNSQILVMAGAVGSGKSRLQHMLVTPLLGGRSADPSRYVFGETPFNSGWMGCEHLLIEDPRPSMKMLDRLQLAQILKALAVNDDQSLHAKTKDEFGVSPEFVVTISINDDPDSIRILPPLTPDFEDKVMLLHVTKRDMPMPTRTPAERTAFQAAVREELPAYLWWLLNECVVPEGLRNDRFGVAHYHDPAIRLMLWEDTPSSELLALIDGAIIDGEQIMGLTNRRPFFEAEFSLSGAEALARFKFAKKESAPARLVALAEGQGRRLWCGSFHDLQKQLEVCQHPRLARKILDHNSVPRLLKRLAEDMPGRVADHRTGAERLWLIMAPEATAA